MVQAAQAEDAPFAALLLLVDRSARVGRIVEANPGVPLLWLEHRSCHREHRTFYRHRLVEQEQHPRSVLPMKRLGLLHVEQLGPMVRRRP